MKNHAFGLFLLMLSITGCEAQSNDAPETASAAMQDATEVESMPEQGALVSPEGWVVRLDKPDESVTIGSRTDDEVYFVDMAPGWHITTHKAAIFYDPERKAEGSFSAKASIHLFDPGDRNREGFGMFVGGRDLATDAQEYIYFLLRNTGDFIVKRRSGENSSVLVDWTHTDAMIPHPHDSTDSVLNELEVNVTPDAATFSVNGTEVARLSPSELNTDGVVGLRMNHGVNVHVSELLIGS